MRQARYWLLTIPFQHFTPYESPIFTCLRGQLERGEQDGYLHWQVIAHFRDKKSLPQVKEIFGDEAHCEPSRSSAANAYVWKEETRVDGTQFSFGELPFDRSDPKDWERVWTLAKSYKIEEIPADIRIRCYGQISRICADYMRPEAIEKEIYVFWGKSGTGKTRRAAEEAGPQAYWKSPTSVWWCGYQSQSSVIIDEFRGKIGIEHLLRWLDRYPVQVEVKGGSRAVTFIKVWITSNLSPRQWYPDLDEETFTALNRRFTHVTHFDAL